MMRVQAAALAAILTCVSAWVAPAVGQETDPRAVLEASAEAVRASEGFRADFKLTGDGSDMLKASLPSMEGRLYFARTADGVLLRAHGESKESTTAPVLGFDILRTPDRVTWVDDAKKTIFERPAKPEARELPTSARLLHVVNLLEENPFASMDQAESVVSEGVQDAGGEACDVVLVSLPAAQNRRAGPSHTAERWYIARSDKLPRRLDQITDAGMVKIVLTTELSNLSTGEQPATELDVRRPDGYTTNDGSPRQPAQPRPAPSGDATGQGEAPAEPEPVAPPVRRAPDFSFTPEGGSAVDNQTQAGRTTVLYFWGTWCIPCTAVSPEVSALAARFADQPVDVFGLAVRERDPAAAREYMQDKEYEHRLVLGADGLVGRFRVWVYPTVVVIGPDGAVALESPLTRGQTPAEYVEGIAAAVEKSLASE